MSEQEGRSSVWEQFVEAKKHASAPDERHAPMTIEELEAAIAEEAAQAGLETGMPPRSVVHPAKRRHLSRWFYLTLVVLFTLLVAGLFWWGRKEYGG